MQHGKTITRESSEVANNIYEELDSQQSGVLATIGKDGKPHLSAIYFTVNENFRITFSTKRGTMKHRNLSDNQEVRFLVYNEANQMTIQVSGTAKPVTSAKRERDIIEHMYDTAAGNDFESPPISKLDAGDYICYEVTPSKITMAIFLRPQRGGYDMFETLEFK